MTIHIIINGSKIIIETDPDSILKDVVQQAINQTDNKDCKPSDFTIIYKENYLAQDKKLTEQFLNGTGIKLPIEGDIIYMCHVSKDVRIWKVNPYRQNINQW